MFDLSHPHTRKGATCPLCREGKVEGSLVCWGCYRKHNLRHPNEMVEQLVDQYERDLDAAAKPAVWIVFSQFPYDHGFSVEGVFATEQAAEAHAAECNVKPLDDLTDYWVERHEVQS